MLCFFLKRKFSLFFIYVYLIINEYITKRFSNGGLLFSTALLSSIAMISLYTFLLLVETRNKIPVSFGDIGGIIFGKKMRFAVLLAITFSQVKLKKKNR